MLDITFEETRVFQEVKEDAMRQGQQEGRIQGRKEAAASLITRQLGKRFGELSEDAQTSILELPLIALEELSEALLDFSDVAEVERWLSEQADQS